MVDFFLKNKNRIDFQDLMQHRVHEILLVSSPYDAYILEEDGRLTEQILTEYLGMNFNYAPRVTRVSTGRHALRTMKIKKFDLIILMLRIEDQDPISLAKSIKKIYPKKPIILLSFDESELKQLPKINKINSIDSVFIWSGDAGVFPAIIKYVEDRKNAKNDIEIGNVRSILLIEDSPRDYSVLLPLIYKEIMYQIKNLIDSSLRQSQRILHLRARPKVFLTPNYNTAQRLFKRYQKNMIGIISDVKFNRNGKQSSEAGIEFVKWVRKKDKSVPILLHSAQGDNKISASKLGVNFLSKESPTLLNNLRDFIINNFGFGDFIFRLPNYDEVGKASNIAEFISRLHEIPDESLLFHAKNHHLSNWLAIRTEFELASRLRETFVDQFQSPCDLRSYIIKELKKEKRDTSSLVSEYMTSDSNLSNFSFARLSGGSLGGKARGLGFAREMIKDSNIQSKFKEIKIRVPNCAVIGTNEFDNFMNDNNLWDIALLGNNFKTLERKFLSSSLSVNLMIKLESFINDNTYPIAIRSSSLLEDSQYQPLSGTYETYMLANNSRSDRKRLDELTTAIKKVYASTFKGEARSLLENTAHHIQEEKMAILIQEIVGNTYEKSLFYPTFSGVLQSINYYPVSYMKRNEGVAYLALGFGRTIVDGEKCLRVSPEHPNILPQFYSIKSIQKNSQSMFYALRLTNETKNNSDLHKYDLIKAEKNGSLKWSGSVLSQEDGTLRDTLKEIGVRVVSFAPILKWNSIPFSDLAKVILVIGKKALGCPVEIEFAVNMEAKPKPEFCLLQIKPMVQTSFNRTIFSKDKSSEQVFCRSNVTLGDGKIETIKDFIVVRLNNFDPSKTKEIAKEVSTLNNLFRNKSQYIISGPGRWGSSDPWLGIPVQWRDISNAKAIIEVGLKHLPVDPSFGSHFFQNIASLHVAYFTINPVNKKDSFDLGWLNKRFIKESKKYIDWYQFNDPLVIKMNGTTGYGEIHLPKSKNELDIMNEEESSGI